MKCWLVASKQQCCLVCSCPDQCEAHWLLQSSNVSLHVVSTCYACYVAACASVTFAPQPASMRFAPQPASMRLRPGSPAAIAAAAAHAPTTAADVAQLLLDGPAASVKREPRTEQQLLHRHSSLGSAGPTSGDGVAADGPSPASSSRGPGDGAAAAAAAVGAAATTSSADQKPATTGVPKNRRPDSWAPWEDVNLGQFKPIQVSAEGVVQ